MLNTARAHSAGTNSRNNYLSILEEAWTAHLAPRAADALTVISTFAGAGGSSLGYSMAGYRELLAVEWDDNAVATFKLNFPDVPVYHGDITNLSVEQVLQMTGLKPGELDVLDGSPPCQGFSTAGKRVMVDPRNQLFREYVRLLRGLWPKVFVMENVSGMVKGKMKLIFADILRELKGSGYRVSARLMNAMYFNVPQSRERMIFVGVRDDLGIEPSHPRGRVRPIAVRDAIGHLPIGDTGNHSPQVINAWVKSRPGKSLGETCRFVGSFQSVRLDPDRPSPTQIKVHLNWHYLVARQLTISEAALIASFPELFRWSGNKAQNKERIGNSVPPLFMRAIAEHIRRTILAPRRESEGA
jgi:DNA (cytosine-5)-methyltransferase 1